MSNASTLNGRIVWLVLWLAFLPFTLAACSSPPLVQQQSYVFGTLVEVSVYDAPEAQARQAIAAVLARFDALHHQLHAWQPSELSRLNAGLAKGAHIPVSPELAAMLRDAQTVSARSNDLFNPAIGNLIALWGFHADTPQGKVPDAAAIARWVKAAPRMEDLHIENNQAWSDNPAVQLDLGGYAKGYALDEAVRILTTHGIKNALVNIGGNVIALGQHGDRPWRVGIQHPQIFFRGRQQLFFCQSLYLQTRIGGAEPRELIRHRFKSSHHFRELEVVGAGYVRFAKELVEILHHTVIGALAFHGCAFIGLRHDRLHRLFFFIHSGIFRRFVRRLIRKRNLHKSGQDLFPKTCHGC